MAKRIKRKSSTNRLDPTDVDTDATADVDTDASALRAALIASRNPGVVFRTTDASRVVRKRVLAELASATSAEAARVLRAIKREGEREKARKRAEKLGTPRPRKVKRPPAANLKERLTWYRMVVDAQIGTMTGLYPGRGGPRLVAEQLEETHAAIQDGRFPGVRQPSTQRLPPNFVSRVEECAGRVLSTSARGGWIESARRRPRKGRGKPPKVTARVGGAAYWHVEWDKACRVIARYAARLASGLSATELNALEGARRVEQSREHERAVTTYRAIVKSKWPKSKRMLQAQTRKRVRWQQEWEATAAEMAKWPKLPTEAEWEVEEARNAAEHEIAQEKPRGEALLIRKCTLGRGNQEASQPRSGRRAVAPRARARPARAG